MVTFWHYAWDGSSRPRGCGGTLVASKWVVTAAHCMWWKVNFFGEIREIKYTKDTLSVVLGEFDLSSASDKYDTNRKEVRLEIDPILHENYHSPKKHSNDIALLKLSEAVDLDTYAPACLPSFGADYTGENGRIYGWGRLRSCPPKRGPSILQEAEVTIISDVACRAQSSDSVEMLNEWTQSCQNFSESYAGKISEEMLCAEAAGKDSCQGDSGGPFTVKKRTTEQHELVGVVSWGYGCASPGMAGVYAEVAMVRPWIDATIAANGGATFCPSD